MKITKAQLTKALQALEDNEKEWCLLDSLGPEGTAEWLWEALGQFRKEERDHRVVFTAEGTLSRHMDASGLSADDYTIEIKSKTDEYFDVLSPKITRMEIR